jgi:hypothetical protein
MFTAFSTFIIHRLGHADFCGLLHPPFRSNPARFVFWVPLSMTIFHSIIAGGLFFVMRRAFRNIHFLTFHSVLVLRHGDFAMSFRLSFSGHSDPRGSFDSHSPDRTQPERDSVVPIDNSPLSKIREPMQPLEAELSIISMLRARTIISMYFNPLVHIV